MTASVLPADDVGMQGIPAPFQLNLSEHSDLHFLFWLQRLWLIKYAYKHKKCTARRFYHRDYVNWQSAGNGMF